MRYYTGMETPLLCPCEFQLVLVYNPKPGDEKGQEIEPETLEAIFDEINKKFGAYTPLAGSGTHGGMAGASRAVNEN